MDQRTEAENCDLSVGKVKKAQIAVCLTFFLYVLVYRYIKNFKTFDLCPVDFASPAHKSTGLGRVR